MNPLQQLHGSYRNQRRATFSFLDHLITPFNSQVAQLEQKLDSLVNLLTKQHGVSSGDENRTDSSTSPPDDLEISNPVALFNNAERSSNDSDSPLIESLLTGCPSTLYPSRPHPPSSMPAAYDFNLPPGLADLLLDEFQAKMGPQIPFVVIPLHWNSEYLRCQKPFLWKAVMTAASYQDTARQEALARVYIEEFGSKLLVKSEKNLDMLQSLIVHIIWYILSTI